MAASFKRKPEWIRNTGLVSVGFCEPLYFLKYCGGQGVGCEEDYAQLHSDESLDGLAAAGVNLVWIHFFKGYGQEFEKEEQERSRDYIGRAHARGLKIGTHITLGSLTPETLLNEEPDAHNWLQVNQEGQHSSCQTTHQCFRARPCYNSEGYQRYMEKVCAHAIECGADLLRFDDFGYNAEPDTCHCPVCVAAFREMLREQYGPHSEETRARGLARFGHHSFTHVRPPTYNRWNQANAQLHIQVVHQQEWVKFKVRSLTRCLARLSRFIEKKNPECAVDANLFKAFGENTDWLHGINYDAQFPLLDHAFSEESHRPGVINQHGATITRARTFKTARAFDIAVQVCHDGNTPELHELSLAENLAFNPKGLGHFGSPAHGFWAPGQAGLADSDPKAKLTKQYLDFYCAHRQEFFLNTRSCAGVAVYRDTASLAWNSVETHRSQVNVEQALIERNVPFDLVYPVHLEDLARYRAVVLPNAECLSDVTVERLRQFVASGGGLLITEDSGKFDDWRRVRSKPAFADMFGTEFIAGQSAHTAFGAGKAVCVPQLEHVEDPATHPGIEGIGDEYWAAPKNTSELLDALSYLTGETPLHAHSKEGRPVCELLHAPSGALLLHVLNMDTAHPVRELEVSVACETKPQGVRSLRPAHQETAVLFEFDDSTKRVRFSVDTLERYILFVIQ